MNIQKEREKFEKHASKFFTTNEAFENDGENYIYDEVKFMWDIWLAAKSQALPEWKDYSQQSPRIDGRYQIFINGEQLAADWKSTFGFADPIEGVALIQELITHWAVLSADPVVEAQEQSHESD